ncbi:MJ0042 family finger-like domain-containing protein [Methylobacillus rhizosphaerae]|uniref:MJ0042 family finger-like domain-containing protein n=1 Tax=Methylobacillus rhizosphaerae TaxID=551994 RepID=A0A238ZDR0_9PROT|nr:DUF3426 domain-containing protein [Methylobacillus rhizosphaerae]SNR81487.1 MJ0042 family finger-like domain-containing protein [Methylobacillus rhizosphaerae]
MQLLTSCPACNTRFHVKPEQLAAHGGHVRCGHCLHIFRASAGLYEVLAPQALTTALPDPGQAPAHDNHPKPEPFIISLVQDAPHFEVTAASAAPSFSMDIAALLNKNHDNSIDETKPETVVESSNMELPEAIRAPLPGASFLAEETPAVRQIPLWLALVLISALSLAAIGQSVYFFRTELVSHWPASRPTLVTACKWLGCTVSLARDSSLLALDDSDLQEDFEHPEVIQLSTTLINNASYAQAFPVLELTLTDSSDQPKLRRIFQPAEYLPPATNIDDGIPAKQSIQIHLAFSTSGETVSGYRVFVTY